MVTFISLLLTSLIILFWLQLGQCIVPPGICADGTPACKFYQQEMCPKNGQIASSYETYAYCCCRKMCGLCGRDSLEQRVENRFRKNEDRSSYDWSGQQWRVGDEWEGMDEFKGNWDNPFRQRGRSNNVRAVGQWVGESGEFFSAESDEEFY